ncbi:hypothetical protein GXP67_20110 [Rhodocytophaga rosea]|uniref:DUF4386 family protein n=1 Tax=Rhodocytophaga rosea TaxID=2704465 RepID=A0A6C0GLC8_9BACT|nr:hypothetical protein [Rhodocytophaga rosea]QHT68789.1 hypothetical protein GXP67_20110 [Rhodocytophaga rosea]
MHSSLKPAYGIQVLGKACIMGGILFAISLITMFSMPQLPMVLREFFQRHDYLLRSLFFLSQMGFMAGLAGLLLTKALGYKSVAPVLLLIPFLGQVCYAVSAWLSTQQVMTLLPLPLTQIGALLNAIGMLIIGIIVVRVKVWQGWQRWIPLSVGLYPFLVMFPILILAGGRPPSTIIGAWGLIWAILGLSIYSTASKKTPVIA